MRAYQQVAVLKRGRTHAHRPVRDTGRSGTQAGPGHRPVRNILRLPELSLKGLAKWGSIRAGPPDRVVLVATRVVFPHAQVEDPHERTDRVWVPPEHNVRAVDVAVRRDVARRHPQVRRLYAAVSVGAGWPGQHPYLLVELDVLDNLEREREPSIQCGGHKPYSPAISLHTAGQLAFWMP
jgi:hypothetical protein